MEINHVSFWICYLYDLIIIILVEWNGSSQDLYLLFILTFMFATYHSNIGG